MTAVLGYFFLREVVTRVETIALAVCFSVITVTGVYKTLLVEDKEGVYTISHILLCLVSVGAFAVINIVGRLLKGFHYSVLCTAQFVLNVVFSLVIAIFACSHLFIPHDLSSAVLIVCLGMSRSFSTLLFVKAC